MTDRRKHLKIFIREDERGAMTWLMLVLFIGILLLTGVSLDLAKHESERADLQSAMDRGVLACASLRQSSDDCDTIIKTFVNTRSLSNYAANVQTVSNLTLNSRDVAAQAEFDMGTDFMGMVGVPTLDVGASTRAIERKTNVEISLVLDISGTMRWRNGNNNPPPGQSRIELLKPAARAFIDKVTENGTNPNVTMNIIPYAGNVNPGKEMFAKLGGVRYLSEEDAALEMSEGTQIDEGGFYQSENGIKVDVGQWFEVAGQSQTISSCLEVRASDFPSATPTAGDSTLGLPNAGGYAQVPHFNVWGFSDVENAVMDWGWCPIDEQEDGTGSMAIKYMSSDADALKDYISQMMLHDGTSTYIGMKYGLALLNPDESARINSLSSVGNSYPNRPAAWNDENTMKIIVLMTDGMYNAQWRPSVPLDKENDIFIPRADGNIGSGSPKIAGLSSQGDIDGVYNDTCDAAKAMGVTVFTIAFDAPGGPADQMRRCATSTSHFFNIEALEIDDAFSAIAGTIQKLKLVM